MPFGKPELPIELATPKDGEYDDDGADPADDKLTTLEGDEDIEPGGEAMDVGPDTPVEGELLAAELDGGVDES